MSKQEPARTISEGLDFILSHFNSDVFPRNISTKATEGRQILVNDKSEALARFERVNNLDCRISAYPPNVLENPSLVGKYLGITKTTPTDNIIMIDLDKQNFKTDRAFNLALTRCLDHIKAKLRSSPSVLWSGRGYHVIQPINGNNVVLEQVKEFDGISDISLKFLRIAESFLSLGKSDLQHNNTVSYNNCMLRIPGSINSKNGEPVHIIQRWDGYRPEINYILYDFSIRVYGQECLRLMKAHKRKQKQNKSSLDHNYCNQIYWIEKLLSTPLADYRKYCIWRIVTPYLLNIRKLSERDTTNIIKMWLNQCDRLRRLDFNPNQKIGDGIEGATKGYLPVSREKLKEENKALYNLVHNQNLDRQGKVWKT